MGLDATRREIDSQKEGLTRAGSAAKPRGKVLELRYALTPNLVFSETNAGAAIGGMASQIPKVGNYAGVLSGLKFAEAQVTMFVIDNETTEQFIAA